MALADLAPSGGAAEVAAAGALTSGLTSENSASMTGGVTAGLCWGAWAETARPVWGSNSLPCAKAHLLQAKNGTPRTRTNAAA